MKKKKREAAVKNKNTSALPMNGVSSAEMSLDEAESLSSQKACTSSNPESLYEVSADTEKGETNEGAAPTGKTSRGITLKGLLTVTVLGILLYWALHHITELSSWLSSAVGVFTPIIAGLAIAFIINAVLNPYERFWDFAFKKAPPFFKRLKRPFCLILAALTVTGAVAAVIFMLIPELVSAFKTFGEKLLVFYPRAVEWLEEKRPLLESFGIVIPQSDFSWESFLKNELNGEKLSSAFTSFITGSGFASFLTGGKSVMDTTVGITTSIFSSIFDAALSFVFAFYLLASKEKVGEKVKATLYSALPERAAREIVRISALSKRTLTSFAAGQLFEAVIIGVLCLIGMKILRIPYAGVVSVVVGATALIPLFGAFIGTAIGAVLILSVDFTKAIWFVVFIIVLQQLETNLIYPRVVGNSLGLPGILVFSAVTVGGAIFGFWGILLGVPVCSVLYGILNEFISKRRKSKESCSVKGENLS